MDFFDQFMNYIENEELRQELIDILMPDSSTTELERMITAHMSEAGDIVFSVFSMEEWKMVTEMSRIIDKEVDEIVKDLGPDDVLQLYIRPDQGPETNQ